MFLLQEEDTHGFKIRSNLQDLLSSLKTLIGLTDNGDKFTFSLILDDEDVEKTTTSQLCIENISKRCKVFSDAIVVIYPQDLETYLGLLN